MVPGQNGDTPARLRTAALERLVSEYPAVVFVDSDDVLHASRVAAAREALQQHDVRRARCKSSTGMVTTSDRCLDRRSRSGGTAARHNVFGLSNSAYRSTVLARCLPAPDEAS